MESLVDAAPVESAGEASRPHRHQRSWLAGLRTARPSMVFGLSLLSGLVVSSVVIVISLRPSRSAWGSLLSHPGGALRTTADTLGRAYGALLSGSVGSPAAFSRALSHWTTADWSNAFAPIGHTLTAAVPLAIGGIGLSVAYRSGVFNIAGPAQMIGGAIAASWVGFSWPGLTAPAHVAVGLVAAAAGGALLGLAPGVLKARTGASEVIVTIMLNYVMANVLVYLVSNTFFSERRNSAPVGRLTVPSGALPFLFGHRVPIDAGIIVAAVVIVGSWLLMSKSRIGLEFELSGMSPGASQTAGINQKRTFVAAFVVSGAIVGLAGGVQVLGSTHQLTAGFGGDVGILAITVAFVGRTRPAGIALAALLYGVLQTGGLHMQGVASVSYQLSNVIEAVIVLFVTAPALVAEIYRLRPAANASLKSLSLSRGWGKSTGTPATRRSWTKSAGLLGLFACLLAAMAINAGDRVTVLVLGTTGITSHPIVHARVWQLCVFTGIICAAGSAAVAGTRGRKAVSRGAMVLGIPAVVLGYLTWAASGSHVGLSNILVATVGGATPLLLGSTAGVLSERSGIINIAIEGQFLAGACAGAVVGTLAHSYWVGLVAGIGAGMLIGLALSLLAIRYAVDQIVAGLILTTLVTGVTGYLAEQTLNPNSATLNSPATFPALAIPGLKDIPVVGRALFAQSVLFYIALAAIAATEIMFAYTRLGLRIRASGEHPSAALSSGVNVRRLRYGVGLVAGGIAGVGGTFFTLGSSGGFLAQMTAGLGYVALAAVIFGGWRPARAALAALLFGFATSLATSLGLLNVHVNPDVVLMLPYLVTIVVVAGAVGASRPPAADGVPLAGV